MTTRSAEDVLARPRREVECAGYSCALHFRPATSRHRFCSRSCSDKANYRRQHDSVRPLNVAPRPAVEPIPTDVAWTAGFLDGEGAFQIQTRRQGLCKTRYVVSAHQVVVEPLLRLQRFWGGVISGPRPSARSNRRPIYEWYVSGRAAADLVQAIQPFLAVKARQADLMLAYADLPGAFAKGYGRGHGLSKQDMDARRTIAEATCRLNRRGASHAA